MLKDYLAQKGVAFTERLVDQDDEALNAMSQESGGFMGVPFSVFLKAGGAKETVIGFDKNRIDTILSSE